MFNLLIKTGNAAFRDPYTGEESSWEENHEVARILREIADKIDDGKREGKAIDYNGNSVGEYTFYAKGGDK